MERVKERAKRRVDDFVIAGAKYFVLNSSTNSKVQTASDLFDKPSIIF